MGIQPKYRLAYLVILASHGPFRAESHLGDGVVILESVGHVRELSASGTSQGVFGLNFGQQWSTDSDMAEFGNPRVVGWKLAVLISASAAEIV